jgi:hypothetical protein
LDGAGEFDRAAGAGDAGVITLVPRKASPAMWTREDWAIFYARVPPRARELYVMVDTKDASLMFALVDQTDDWRREQQRREAIDRGEARSP